MQDTHAHTNRLAGETSPYLLQHAHNPVDWYPWGEEAFSKARMENKLVLISIGYSSCHWCHVMERESFENDSIARYMNEHFINIKVDREERPDVDQVYMAAVQLMTGRGGWPLNCFALPDGRPVYGGTYYPPAQWKQVLQDLHTTWKQEPERVKGYAERLSQGVAELDLVLHNEDAGPFQARDLERYVDRWETEFDRVHGGPDRAPKFPMPNNLMYLLDHGALFSDTAVLAHVRRTLDKMAMGGIFDQAGGGFARYSTDVLWKAPHFEKMLYDNAQLVSLYSRAWQAFKDPLYQQVVERTLEFIAREMTAEPGVFHSALDADTEGEEGRYYVWTRAELQAALGLDMSIAEAWYDLPGGLWEEDRIILLRRRREAEVARELAMSPTALAEAVDRVNGKLLEVRERRERPGLDDKSLTSWNALMAIGYCDAYAAFGREEWLRAAEACLTHIITKRRTSDGGLAHTYKQGRATINGYLEDYCFTLEALLALYSITFEERWLREAEQLTTYVIEHFSDARSGMFHFTSDLDPPLIARKMEVSDNVIPASNSSMAHALLRLGHLFERPGWLSRSEQMLQNVKPQMEGYPSGYSNWALLMLAHVKPLHEIVITGPECREKRREFGQHHLPNTLFVGAVNDGSLPLLEQRFLGGTTIFVCQNKSCQLPVSTVPEALKQLR